MSEPAFALAGAQPQLLVVATTKSACRIRLALRPEDLWTAHVLVGTSEDADAGWLEGECYEIQ